MRDPSKDERFMRQALSLAAETTAQASPNPYVGAIIANPRGEVVGSGAHTYAGVKHAEVLALEQAGEAARGATLYVTLEPCSHHGRTAPCAEAVVAAGIARVVAAMQDPNPQVSGRGFARLKDAGVAVDVGVMAAEAQRLNEGFTKYIRTGMPLVTIKSALTLDGKIARTTASGPEWITGEAAHVHAQQLRHKHDAILAGVATAIADDPLLTDRTGLSRHRPLLRVVLDSHLRLPIDSRLVQSADNDLAIFFVDGEAPRQKVLEQQGIRLEQISAGQDGRTDPVAVLRRLGDLQITSLLVEGGSAVNGAFLAAGVVDKLFLYYAPKILGSGAVPFATSHSGDIRHLTNIHTHRFGEDFAIEGYLREPYE